MPIDMSRMKPGSQRTLANGAQAAYFNVVGKPKPVFRIFASTRGAVARAQAARRNPRQITKAQAQQAFDRFYKGRRMPTFKRGANKGKSRFSSLVGRQRAMTYDIRHGSKPVVNDVRYLNNPHAYDFQGVDTGTLVRKPLSAAQRNALAAGRAKRRRTQTGGYWF